MMICSLPPPLHGQSLVNDAVRRRLALPAGRVCDIAPGNRRGVAYHAGRLRRVLRALVRLARVRPQRLYLSSESGWGVVYLLALVATARLVGVGELYLHHHVYAYLTAPGAGHRFLMRLAGARCRHIVLSDRMAADFHRTFATAAPPLVVHNAPFIEAALKPEAAVERGDDVTTLGFIGRLDAEKGFDVFLDLVDAYADEPRVRFRVAGDAAGSPLRGRLERARAELGDRLGLAGFVAGPTKANFFAELDVLVFPSKYANEASPMVCYEALAARVAVMVTRVGAVEDLVDDDCGVVLEPGPGLSERVAAAVASCLDDPARLDGWRRGARHRFVQLEARAEAELGALSARLGAPAPSRPGVPPSATERPNVAP